MFNKIKFKMVGKQTILLITCFTLFCFVNVVNSARILFMLPSPSLSHHIFYGPIIKELSLRGHDVVSITPDPINNPNLTNLTEIDVHDETYEAWSISKWLEECQTQKESALTKFRKNGPMILQMFDSIMSAPEVKQLIRNPKEYFDVVIVEMLPYPPFFALKEHFNSPLIGLSSLDASINGLDAVGNPPDPNYFAGFFASKGGPNLSFWERLDLFWHQIDYRIFYYWEHLPKSNELVKKHLNLKTENTWELEKRVDLVITNTNPIFHIPRPLVPNFIQIGGLHKRERKPLPEDLKSFLDNSPEGVVYFSLGSNVRSGNLPAESRKGILKAFQQLPYKIIWKWENSTLADKPKNVLIKQWLPQQDVLEHPNIKAFVTQGGLQSLEEAIQSHVPMVGIPFGGDQEFNVYRIVALEIGRHLDYNEITAESLVESIKDVASNPKYKNNIKKVATFIYDQQTKPLDRAIWWIEYVIRHKGAQHLRSPAADLPWYKYLLLDILGFIIGIVIFLVIVIINLLKFVLKHLLFSQQKCKEE